MMSQFGAFSNDTITSEKPLVKIWGETEINNVQADWNKDTA